MICRNSGYCVLFLLSATMLPALTRAQTTAQRVSVSVSPIVVMSVFGEPGPLLIHGGQNQTTRTVEDASSYYNLTTNVPRVEITAVIDTPMPAGTSLRLLGEATLGMSSGSVDISTAKSPVVVISGINRGLENGQSLTYLFSADNDIENIPLQNRTVTLALVDPSTGLASVMVQTVSFGVTPGASASTSR
jgi:hypothetical protein